jgi:uncharacterized membrane protein
MTWIAWSLLSALFAAATALLAKKRVAGVDPNLATAIRTTVVVLFAWAIAIGFGVHHGVNHSGRKSCVLPGIISTRDRALLDLLLLSPFVGTCVQSRSDRYAQRCLRHSAHMAHLENP